MLLGAAMKQADIRIDPLPPRRSNSSTRRGTPCAAGCWGSKLIVKLRGEGSAMAAETITPGQRPSCALVPSAADLKFAPSKTEIPCQSQQAVALGKQPLPWTSGGCARAASGHAAAL